MLKRITGLLIFGTLCGCTKAVPQVTSLMTSVWLSLNASVIHYKTLNDIQVTGTCDPADQEVDYSLDNGNTWTNINQGSISSSFACNQSQSFSVDLNLVSNTPAAWSGSPSGNYHVLFRAKVLGGFSDSLNLVLSQMTSSTRVGVTNSSSRQTVSGYQVSLRVLSSASGQDVGNFHVQMGVPQ